MNLLTVHQVAARLALASETVYRMIRQGTLPHVRLRRAIRVSEDAVEAIIEKGRLRTSAP